ncbi:MAG: lambda exonuclease family protein [Ktedonobacteraceae bacterium]
MRIVECEQGSAQWLDERVGRITASRVAEALSKYKLKSKTDAETAERRNYKVDLIVERLTGRSTENFNSPEMQWGTLYEPEARTAYEMQSDVMTEQVGFILHPLWDFSGASPDSLIGLDGGLEIKCPKSATHYKWRKAGVVPEEHQAQVLWNMHCAGRAWWDFASYDPRMPDGLRLFVVRMYRDDDRITEIEAEVMRFNQEIEAEIAEDRKCIVAPQPKAPTDHYDDLMQIIGQQELVP